MRLFIALPLTQQAKQKLSDILSELRQYGGKVKWVNPEIIHLTVRFLGDTDENVVGDLGDLLDKIASDYEPIETTIDSLGGFPNLKQPRVIWAGLADGPPVESCAELTEKVEQAVRYFGFLPDNKRFRPHLTLGRVKGSKGLSNLLDQIIDYRLDPIPLTLDRICLFKSTLTPRGPIYECLHEAKLGKQDRLEG
ncbi:MAG: RNA 2',3'-cyclic phosphodiesterase [candidate division Zixibacteria bacterium]|nr:RNA 2',3'-cyclic phosphodiesterase [candidate division Zixibacteria bacterium]